MAIAFPDMYMEAETDDYLKYSGVYFKEFREGGRVFRFSRDNLPNRVYTAKFIFAKTELVDVKPIKRMKIFENGKFIGQSIVDEDKFSY